MELSRATEATAAAVAVAAAAATAVTPEGFDDADVVAPEGLDEAATSAAVVERTLGEDAPPTASRFSVDRACG